MLGASLVDEALHEPTHFHETILRRAAVEELRACDRYNDADRARSRTLSAPIRDLGMHLRAESIVRFVRRHHKVGLFLTCVAPAFDIDGFGSTVFCYIQSRGERLLPQEPLSDEYAA